MFAEVGTFVDSFGFVFLFFRGDFALSGRLDLLGLPLGFFFFPRILAALSQTKSIVGGSMLSWGWSK
jgi:hypothetical protein